ncbi:MAG: polyprenyl synthetase family protein [Phycisphaerales bacterium]|nr:MAG: polyprenyl synthetase family protein [Phycisphaerales bacterium]
MSSAPTGCQDVPARLARFARRFEPAFARLLETPPDVPERLAEAMRYSALGVGKRIRPFLVVRCCELVGGCFDDALGPAAAVECVHAFSLVHDDLPAMDDDDLRRGRPTNHKVYGDAMAILAGDALLALAFELIATGTPDAARAGRLTAELARGAGWQGMIGGQVADIAGQTQDPDLERVRYIHECKTASLIATACRLGAIAGGGDAETIQRLGNYGRHVGLAFQIADDLLDVTSSAEVMGKAVDKDAAAGKQTYPGCVGIAESRRAGMAAVDAAVAALAPSGEPADDLRDLARFCMEREH